MGRKRKEIDSSKGRPKKIKRNFECVTNDLSEDTFTPKHENLDLKTIREGMLILGCVKNVRKTSFEISLPGCLQGIVEANNISNAFTKAICSNDPNKNQLEISSFIECGMMFPCKINSIEVDTLNSNKKKIFLSIKPDDIYANLKPPSLYLKMVLYVSICSIEDHGYVVDVGSECIQAFLPKKNCHSFNCLSPGQLIPTFIKKIFYNDKKSAKVQLSQLDFNEEFPTVNVENIKLHCLLPGTKINVDVIDMQKHFVIMKYHNFDACASLLSNAFSKNVKVGSVIQTTVLYVNHVTNMIHVTLQSTPTPKSFQNCLKFQKFEIVNRPKFLYFYKHHAYYKILKQCFGFISTQDLPVVKDETATLPNSVKTDVEKACVLNLFYMDNLIKLTAKPSLIEKKIILPQDVKVGDCYDAVVKKHEDYGMYVTICIGLSGLVEKYHLSDVYVTKPEVLYPVGSTVQCRVLLSDEKGKIKLTCKESLINLPLCDTLSSYKDAQRNNIYTGVVVKVDAKYLVVTFFNDVKGIVLPSNIPKASVYFLGQTVRCQVVRCDPVNEQLKLSLQY